MRILHTDRNRYLPHELARRSNTSRRSLPQVSSDAFVKPPMSFFSNLAKWEKSRIDVGLMLGVCYPDRPCASASGRVSSSRSALQCAPAKCIGSGARRRVAHPPVYCTSGGDSIAAGRESETHPVDEQNLPKRPTRPLISQAYGELAPQILGRALNWAREISEKVGIEGQCLYNSI